MYSQILNTFMVQNHSLQSDTSISRGKEKTFCAPWLCLCFYSCLEGKLVKGTANMVGNQFPFLKIKWPSETPQCHTLHCENQRGPFKGPVVLEVANNEAVFLWRRCQWRKPQGARRLSYLGRMYEVANDSYGKLCGVQKGRGMSSCPLVAL